MKRNEFTVITPIPYHNYWQHWWQKGKLLNIGCAQELELQKQKQPQPYGWLKRVGFPTQTRSPLQIGNYIPHTQHEKELTLPGENP